ncbi:RNA polymerase II-associated factor 1, partial [Tremellales sp. Uapishka_1]
MSKKSKLDLLVRVRYLNPLPTPPFPPKLLAVSTDINRLGEPSYLDQLVASTPLPMLVDSEMGMPLDLNAYDGVWDGDDSALNPSFDLERKYHPDDQALFGAIRLPSTASGMEKPTSTAEVPWMRNSSYITRKNNAKRKEAAEAAEKAETVDASETAQVMAIDKSFTDLHDQKAEEVKHPDPKKKGLKVVESYDILPADNAWSNPYILVRFPERPSSSTAHNPSAGASSPRLAKAVLQPILEEDLQIMHYYLPKEDDLERLGEVYKTAITSDAAEDVYEASRVDPKDPKINEMLPNVMYDYIRTYEVVSQARPSKEILLSFIEEEPEDDEPARKKRKGVYFKEISMRTLLKKTRAQGEDDERKDIWSNPRIGYRIPDEEEVEHRMRSNGQVSDPLWVDQEMRRLQGGENFAEGQGEAIDDEEAPLDEGAIRAEQDEDDD